ncbi:MAG: hypothetical protein RL701_1951 [Pseudomonadota bacterium]
MTSIAETPLARLENEHRLINGNVKDAGKAPGSFLYRGELAITHGKTGEVASVLPDLKADQVMIAATAGKTEFSFYTCHLQSFASLKPMVEMLGDTLGASGKYFAFCSNINYPGKYKVAMGAATFYVLPLEDKAAFNELLELLNIEHGTIKKLGLVGKLESVANSALKFNPNYEQISYERGLEVMSPAAKS